MQYLRARYYDSSQGRFTAKDTYLGNVEYPLSRNLYAYCYNNPLNYTDPSGHIGVLAALAIGVGVGAVVGAVSGGISNAISQHKSGGEFDSKSFWRSVGIGAAGGLVGGVAGAATGAIIGAAGGSTTGIAAGAAIGAASGISGGMAYRYTGTKLNNSINGSNDSALKAAYNPVGITVDGILGGLGGAISAGVTSGKIKNPFKNTSGTRGEQQAAKAYIESVKKYCGENGAEYHKAQNIESPVNMPESAAITTKTISSNTLKHINNSHNPNAYAQQLAHKPIEDVMGDLNTKSFFNSSWTKDYINNAVNYGYEQALQKGHTNGIYQYSYFGEEITIYMKNGQVDTAYGNYHYTYEELLELLS